MSFLKNTFLYKLYQTDKAMAMGLVLYVLGILYCCRYSREEFPFLLYGMYSLKEPAQATYTTYTFVVDDKEMSPAGLLDAKQELITAPLKRGAMEYKTGKLDTTQMKALTNWIYEQYFTPWESDKHPQRDIYELTYTYNNNGEPQLLKKELLYRNVQP